MIDMIGTLGFCILLEVTFVGAPIGLAFYFGSRLFSPRYPNRIVTCGHIAFFLGIAGLFVSFQLSILVFFADYHEGGYAFSPLAWSPDGKRLAFGLIVDGFTGWTVFVMDADGKNVEKSVDLNEDEYFTSISGPQIKAIRWDKDSVRVLFMATGIDTSFSRNTYYYAIDPKERNPERISEDQFWSLSSVNIEDTPDLETTCSARHIIEDRAVYDNRLVAQSVCSGTEYGWTVPWHECYQVLEICEVSTGKVLSALVEDPLRTREGIRKEKMANFALRASGVLTLIGSIVSIVVILYRWLYRG